MSGGLAPSKSTVYVSNLPYALTNNDLHKIFEEFGRVIKVTIVKDSVNRRSKGVAFILYLKKDDARECVKKINGKEMFGRTLKASIAKDNGRTAEFIRRKEYPDKSSCFECGEKGHQSYSCPKNSLGTREPPPKKVRVRKKKTPVVENYVDSDEDDLEPDVETLSAAIQFDAAEKGVTSSGSSSASERKKIFKKSSYFSDEEETSD